LASPLSMSSNMKRYRKTTIFPQKPFGQQIDLLAVQTVVETWPSQFLAPAIRILDENLLEADSSSSRLSWKTTESLE
jgi:hypothetical protein